MLDFYIHFYPFTRQCFVVMLAIISQKEAPFLLCHHHFRFCSPNWNDVLLLMWSRLRINCSKSITVRPARKFLKSPCGAVLETWLARKRCCKMISFLPLGLLCRYWHDAICSSWYSSPCQATYPDDSMSLIADYTLTTVSCGLKVNVLASQRLSCCNFHLLISSLLWLRIWPRLRMLARILPEEAPFKCYVECSIT